MELSRIKPNDNAPVNPNQVHIDGNKLVNDSVQPLYYYTFEPKMGYIEVKVYEDHNGDGTDTLRYSHRCYSDQSDAEAYCNLTCKFLIQSLGKSNLYCVKPFPILHFLTLLCHTTYT